MSDRIHRSVSDMEDLCRLFGGWLSCPDCGGEVMAHNGRLQCRACGRRANKPMNFGRR